LYGVFTFAFADGIAILSENTVKLSQIIDIVEKWCNKNSMKLNKNKCGILFLHKRCINATNRELK
jgi:hypothetical protein